MAIPASCSCGRQVNAPDHLAGKTVKCPGCGNPLTIPASAPGASGGDLFDEAGMAEGGCPKCGSPMKPNAVLCVSCGYNRQTGTTIEGAGVKSTGHMGAADQLLAKAEEALSETPTRHDDAHGGKGQEWIVMAGMLGIAGVIVICFYAFFQHMEKKKEEEEKKKGPELGYHFYQPSSWHDDFRV